MDSYLKLFGESAFGVFGSAVIFFILDASKYLASKPRKDNRPSGLVLFIIFFIFGLFLKPDFGLALVYACAATFGAVFGSDMAYYIFVEHDALSKSGDNSDGPKPDKPNSADRTGPADDSDPPDHDDGPDED